MGMGVLKPRQHQPPVEVDLFGFIIDVLGYILITANCNNAAVFVYDQGTGPGLRGIYRVDLGVMQQRGPGLGNPSKASGQ